MCSTFLSTVLIYIELLSQLKFRTEIPVPNIGGFLMINEKLILLLELIVLVNDAHGPGFLMDIIKYSSSVTEQKPT